MGESAFVSSLGNPHGSLPARLSEALPGRLCRPAWKALIASLGRLGRIHAAGYAQLTPRQNNVFL